jgi:hypothetical protein
MPHPGKVIPLTENQQVQYEYVRAHPGSGHYVLRVAFQAEGLIDEERLGAAARLMAKRHMPLRSRFIENDGTAVMLDDERLGGFLLLPSAQDTGTGNITARVSRVLSDAQPIDIEQGPTWRLTLVTDDSAKQSAVILEASHLVMDYQSLLIFFRELSALYNGTDLPPIVSSYGDLRRHQDNWRAALPAEAIADRARRLQACRTPWNPDRDNEEKPYTRALSEVIEGGGRLLKRAAHSCRVPASAILTASLANALHTTTGLEEVLLGIPYAARPFPGLENLIGDFSNTILTAGRARDSKMAEIIESGRDLLDALDLWPVHVSELLRHISGASFQIRVEIAEQADQLARTFPIPGQPTTLLEIDGPSRTMRRNLSVTYDTTGDDATIEVCLTAGSGIGASPYEFAQLVASQVVSHCHAVLTG